MNEEFDFSGFAREVECAASALLDDMQSTDELIQAARVVQEMAETAMIHNPSDTSLIACGPGCSHCCMVNVAVLNPEAVTLVAYLERKLSPEKFEELRQKIEQLHARIEWLDDEERITKRLSCALLDDQGNCSVHPVRPLLCRGMTSIDPETCRQAIDLHIMGEAPLVLSNLFQASLFNHAFFGLAQAMENVGLDSRSRELTEAMHTLIEKRPSELQ